MAEVIVSETPEALSERVAADFAALVESVLQRQERFYLALAGGQTPKLFYSRLAKEPYRSQIPWSRLWVFWGDERCVPKDHPESNFRMASEALLQYVPIPPAHVFRMRGEDPPPSAARDYDRCLHDIFSGQTWPRFDLILLGMGPDGHTASLIAGTPAVMVDHPSNALRTDGPAPAVPAGDRWVVGNVVRQLQTVRITFTFPAINHAKNVWFLVTGAKKGAAYAKVQEGPDENCPASLVNPVEGELRWYLDKAVVSPQTVPPSRG